MKMLYESLDRADRIVLMQVLIVMARCGLPLTSVRSPGAEEEVMGILINMT